MIQENRDDIVAVTCYLLVKLHDVVVSYLERKVARIESRVHFHSSRGGSNWFSVRMH